MSNGENLSEVLKDERLDTLPEHYQERSPILIEPIEARNIGTEETTKTIHLVASLTEQERPDFIKFFKQRQINFAWSCTNMPRLDPDLIMHHLSIAPGIKLVKHKLRKMHPHIAPLVKA